MAKKSREENLNSKIQSVEKRIKELDFEKAKAYKQIEKWNKEIEKIHMDDMENYCKKIIQNNYFRYVTKKDNITTMWLLYFDKFEGVEDDYGIMLGKSISLTYNNDVIEAGWFDTNARIFIDPTYDDSCNGYFKKGTLIETTKEAFDEGKKLIIDFLNK